MCLNDRVSSMMEVSAYAADEIYAIDYLGGAGPQIRLYTKRFLESGRRILPYSMGCR